MYNINNPDLIKVEKLIHESQYEEANSLLDALEIDGTLTEFEKTSYLILKSTYLNKIGDYEKALKFGEKAYKRSQELKLELQIIDALVNMAYAYMWIGNFAESMKSITESETLLENLKKKPSNHIKRREGEISYTKAGLYYWLGNAVDGMECAKRSLELREEIGEKSKIAESNFIIGALYAMLKTDYDTALSYATRAQTLAEETNNFQIIAMNLMNLGIIHSMKGEFKRALEYNLKCIPMFEHTDNIILISAVLGNTAFNYLTLGNYDEAFNYLEKAEELARKSQNNFILITLLANKVEFSIEMERLEEAQTYFDQIKDIKIQLDDSMTEHTYRLVEAELLASLPGIDNQEKAEINLRELLNEDLAKIDIKITTLIYLCEVLFKKLKRTNDSDILDEISSILNILTNIAKESNSFWVLAETYTLQAKLAIMILDIKGARRLLTQAQKIAEEQGIQFLAKKISIEHDNILQEMNKLESLKKEEVPISERIDMLNIEDQMRDLIWKRDLSTLESSNEDPVVLLVLTKGGTPIFSHTFSDEWSFESDLFGGFLSAINSFSGELFAEGLDRAKFGQHTIIMNQIESLLVCYLFKGHSYQAHKRINDFLRRIQSSNEIWNAFNLSKEFSQVIEYRNLPELKTVVDEIFISDTI